MAGKVLPPIKTAPDPGYDDPKGVVVKPVKIKLDPYPADFKMATGGTSVNRGPARKQLDESKKYE